MIMQCSDYNDDDFEFAPAPVDSNEPRSAPLDPPGFLYRGVPQDHRCRTLRVDTLGLPAAGVHGQISGSHWLEVSHVTREFNVSELFFG
jgi:hypothetical protein